MQILAHGRGQGHCLVARGLSGRIAMPLCVVRDVDATRSVLQFRQRGRIGGVHLFVSREDGKIAEVTYQEPFDLIFSDPKTVRIRKCGAGDGTRTRVQSLGFSPPRGELLWH